VDAVEAARPAGAAWGSRRGSPRGKRGRAMGRTGRTGHGARTSRCRCGSRSSGSRPRTRRRWTWRAWAYDAPSRPAPPRISTSSAKKRVYSARSV
jgi:hypothetical protein